MDCILRPLINEYKETFGRDLEKIAEFYSDIFHQTSVTKEAKAEIALIGSHQQYLNDVRANHDAARTAISKLADAQLWNKGYTSFDDLYRDVYELISRIKGIGGLTIYDTSLRISYAMKSAEVKKVYLNRGARLGAEILLGKKAVTSVMDVSVFEPYTGDLSAIHIENFLCIYKKVLSYKGYHDDIPFPKHHTCCCFCRSNMLAYKIMVLHDMTAESKFYPNQNN